jgi:peptidoglycan hydrolase-like protein with peptidoglycan-binding domain
MKSLALPIKSFVNRVAIILLSGVLCSVSTAQKSASKSERGSSKSASSKLSRSGKAHASSRKGKRAKASWRRGQQKMDTERARQVQEALIREHYFTGEPNGVWDQRSQSAMMRFQADNGWQTKIVPDSRALIKLGLGPNQDHLLNPESAMTSPVLPASADRVAPTNARDHVTPASTTISPTSAAGAEPVSNHQK